MGAGIIVSETPPDNTNRYTWYKPSTREWYEKSDGGWVLTVTEPPVNGDLGNVNLTGTVSVAGDRRITGSRVVANIRITVKEGIITGFAPV